MNKQAKEAWLADLTSGKYRQGEGALKARDDGRIKHCCLGVLCDTYARTVKKPKASMGWEGGEPRGYTEWSFGDGDTGMPPAAVLGWAGLSEAQAEALADMNDSGKKFREIANYIRENL